MASMKKNMKLKGRLKSYMQTSIYLGLLLVAVNLLVYILDVPSGLVLTCFALFYFAVTAFLQLYNKPIIMNEMVSFATQYGQIQKVLLLEDYSIYTVCATLPRGVRGELPCLF